MNETEYRSYWPEWQLQKCLFSGEYCVSFLAVRQDGEKSENRMIQCIRIPPESAGKDGKFIRAVGQLAEAGVDKSLLQGYFGRLRTMLEKEMNQYAAFSSPGVLPVLQSAYQDAPSGIGWTAWLLCPLDMPLSYYRNKHVTGAEEAVRCGRDLAGALAEMEAAGTCHGEVCDTTVVRAGDGTFRMTCFAQRRVLEMAGQMLFPHKSTVFDAPEVREERKFSIRGDIYSLGVIMGFLLCGGEVPEDEALSQAFKQHRRLVSIIRQAMAEDPTQRFASARELLTALEEPGLITDTSKRFAEPASEETRVVLPVSGAVAAAAPILAPSLPDEQPTTFWGKIKALLQPLEDPDEDLPEEDEEENDLPDMPAPQEETPIPAEEAPAEPAPESPSPAEPVTPVYAEEDSSTEKEIGSLVATMIEENGIGDGLKGQSQPLPTPEEVEAESGEAPEAELPEAELSKPEEDAETFAAPEEVPAEESDAEEEPAEIPEETPEELPEEAPEETDPIHDLLGHSPVFDDAELRKIITDAKNEAVVADMPDFTLEKPQMTEDEEDEALYEETRKKKISVGLIIAIVIVAAVAFGLIRFKPWQYLSSSISSWMNSGAASQVTAQVEDTTETASDATDSSYLLPSDTKELTLADLEGLSEYDSYMAMNEIYARHGYIFSTDSLKAYFENKTWYQGTTESSIEVYNAMSEVEQKNIETIMEYQVQMGYREDTE